MQRLRVRRDFEVAKDECLARVVARFVPFLHRSPAGVVVQHGGGAGEFNAVEARKVRRQRPAALIAIRPRRPGIDEERVELAADARVHPRREQQRAGWQRMLGAGFFSAGSHTKSAPSSSP